MKRLSVILVIGIVVLLVAPANSSAQCTTGRDLIAAQHYDVGSVTVTSDTTNVTVQYLTEDGYCMTETHLYVDPEKPTKSAPGRFPWGDDNLQCVSGWEQTIPLIEFGNPSSLWVAAHAVVCEAGADFTAFDDFLAGEMATAGGYLSASFVGQGGSSYWQIQFNNGDGLSGNTYPGWCVDTDHTIGGTRNDMLVIPTYIVDEYGDVILNPAIFPYIENPETIDQVNWIVNQGFVGSPSDCDGNYTQGDVQRAIWTLVEDENSTSGLGSWKQCRVDEILAGASTNGEGFVPGCGDVVAVLLVDDSAGHQYTIFQVTFFELGIPCIATGNCETAWGSGDPIRPGKNWATTFEHVCN